ncbi:HDOD domain-containing protein [bacterium]|nr:HDOD domain-containing protein [bacterium]
MKTIAYLCSYEQNNEISEMQISKQRADILNFCKVHNINVDEIYNEITEKYDYKPVLLNIMSESYNTVERIIIANFDVISPNKDFKDWVKDEFARMKIEIICVNSEIIMQEDIQSKNISALTENIKNIPSLPEIITKSIEIMQDKNTSSETLAKIISNDIGLTARVLKLVNSSYYGFPKQISTVKQAITILGFTTIKGLIISASVFKMFSESSSGSAFNYKNFWKHSMMVATASRMLAEYSDIDKSEDIFSASFLHDIGKIILAKYDRENYSKVCKQNYKTDFDFMKSEENFCGLNHCEIGNVVAYSWNLPELFCEIISNHHNPEKSYKCAQECYIVNIANKIAEAIESNENLSIDDIALEKINISGQNVISVHEKLIANSSDFDDIDKFLK